MAQPDGSYPRVNAAMLQTGQYNGMIVSLVGKVRGNDGTHIKFESADGGLVQVSLEQADFPAGLAGDAVLELVGLAGSPQELTVGRLRQ